MSTPPRPPLPVDLGPLPCPPDEAYLRLAPLDPRFLLESAGPASPTGGRWSLLGLGEAQRLVVPAGPHDRQALLQRLREALAQAPRFPRGPVPFGGGLVGAASFDLVRSLEPRVGAGRPTGAEEPPVLDLLAPRAVLAFDHHEDRLLLLGEAEPDAVRALLARPTPALESGRRLGPATASMDDAAFLDAVRRAQDHIRLGDVFQLVLSLRLEGETDLHPFAVYQQLRRLNPSPYLYYLDLGRTRVCGSSPEALVRLRDGVASLRPIAGTRPRGADEARDDALQAELEADPKEAAEHVMLVDLARNDLGRVAAPGSVQVHPFRTVERYSHVMHLVSGVTGRLAQGRDGVDLYAASFPAGTVSGAPKVRALELIDELEPGPRGLYAGTVGWFGADGDLDQAIAIRTLVFSEGRYRVQAGAGIVHRSVPEAELAECRAKARALMVALEQAHAAAQATPAAVGGAA